MVPFTEMSPVEQLDQIAAAESEAETLCLNTTQIVLEDDSQNNGGEHSAVWWRGSRAGSGCSLQMKARQLRRKEVT